MDRSPAETPLSLRANLLDPLVSLHWEKRNDLPVEIDGAHSVWLNGKLYVGGGDIYDGVSDARLLVYSPSEDSWEVIPTPTEYYALATYHSQLVLVGGQDPTTGKPTSKVWLLEDRSWVPHPTVPDMPVSTFWSSAVGFGDYLIVAGSEQGEGSTAMSVFDGQNWLSAQALPERLFQMKSAVNGDDWYLTEGQVVYRTSLKSLVASAVSPAAAAAAQSAVWERLPDTPHAYSGIAWFGDHLLAVGGSSSGKEKRTVYAFNPQANVWKHVSDLPGDGCYGNCCAVLPTGELLVIGGYDTNQRVLKATITAPNFPDGLLSIKDLKNLEVKGRVSIFRQIARHSEQFIKATSIPCSGKTPGKKLLEKWLQQTQPPPTWSTLLDILKKIGLSKVAQKIREFFESSRSTEVEEGDQRKDVEEKTSKELFQDVEQAVEDLGQKGNRQKVQAAMEKLEALKERVGEEKEELEDKLQQAFALIHELKMEQEQLESDYEESEYSDSENPFIKQECSESETEADVKPVVKLEHPVKRRVKQKEVMSARKPTSKASTELRGVEAIAETVLRVTNTGRSFHWAGYGLKLSFPADCLPPGVEECLLRIQASLSGQYQLPGDASLVSAVYWFKTKPRITFEKPFTLEIQNCAKPENSSKLRFYRASSSQPELPYSFQPLEGGVFASHSCYGSVQLQQFCGVTVGQEGEGEKNCCTSLFYLGEGKQKQIDFVISLHLDAYLTVVLEEYAQRDALVGLNEVVQFESDAILLDIDDGGVAKNGWQLLALSAPTVEKKQVDSFKPGQIIPRCQLLLQAIEPEAKMFLHRLVMKGAKPPRNFMTVFSELLSPVKASQSLEVRRRQQASFKMSKSVPRSHEFVKACVSTGVVSEDDVSELAELLIPEVAGHWQLFLGALGVTSGVRAQLQLKHPHCPKLCLLEGVEHWVVASDCPSFERIIRALRGSVYTNRPLATKVEDFVRLKYGPTAHSALFGEVRESTSDDNITAQPDSSLGVGGKHKLSEDSQSLPSSGVASSEPSKKIKLDDSTGSEVGAIDSELAQRIRNSLQD